MNAESISELGQFSILGAGKCSETVVFDSDPPADTKVLGKQVAIRRVAGVLGVLMEG